MSREATGCTALPMLLPGVGEKGRSPVVCFTEQAKPGAVTFSIGVDFGGQRGRDAGRQQHERKVSHRTDSIRKGRNVFCFFLKKKATVLLKYNIIWTEVARSEWSPGTGCGCRWNPLLPFWCLIHNWLLGAPAAEPSRGMRTVPLTTRCQRDAMCCEKHWITARQPLTRSLLSQTFPQPELVGQQAACVTPLPMVALQRWRCLCIRPGVPAGLAWASAAPSCQPDFPKLAFVPALLRKESVDVWV